MQTTQESTVISQVIITIGIVHFSLGLAMGALVGASLFILTSQKRAPLLNVVYFTLAFIIGLFGGQSLGAGLSKLLRFLPDTQFIDEFSGAVLSAALFIVLIELVIKRLQTQPNTGGAKP